MKECCKVDDTSKPSNIKKRMARGFWLLLLLVAMGLAIADVMGQ
ncbi:MAG: hypothetical protein ABJQ84_07720 [Ekhidna sp.]